MITNHLLRRSDKWSEIKLFGRLHGDYLVDTGEFIAKQALSVQ